jgi:hypothetical protein
MNTLFKRLSICAILLVLILPLHLYGKTGDSNNEATLNNPPPTDTSATGATSIPTISAITATSSHSASPFQSFEFMLSVTVLLFGLIVIGLEVFLASKGIIDSDHIFKCVIPTLVITGSIVLITAGYSNNQITGASGILGSIAGYMVAKTLPSRAGNNKNHNNLSNKAKYEEA